MNPTDPPPPAPDLRASAGSRRGTGRRPSWQQVPPAPVATLPRRTRTTAGTVLGLLAIAAAGLLTLGGTIFSVGLGPTIASTLLAVVPFAGVAGYYLWLDRYEPHPRSAVVLALAWGGIVSTTLAGLVPLLYLPFIGALPSQEALAVVQAPIVEEILKGAGVVFIARRWREDFHSLVDGLVIAGLVGAGFAFVENIFYFGTAMSEGAALGATAGAAELTLATFVLRGVASPFAHSLFTSATGLGVAHAERRGGWSGSWAIVIGLLAAIALHALWNGAATAGNGVFVVLYVVAMVPLFIVVKVVAARLRRDEGRKVVTALGDYVEAGWLHPWEPDIVTSLSSRRQFSAWVRRVGHDLDDAEAYQQDLVRLAHLRERAIRRTPLPDDREREHLLLRLVRARRPWA